MREKVELFGERRSLRAWCKHFGVKYSMVYTRISRGASVEDALFKPKHASLRPLIEIDGQRRTTAGWARRLGIATSTFRKRKMRRWPPEKMTAPNRRVTTVTAFGRTQTYTEWARETGIHRQTIHSRLAIGMTPEAALTAPVAKKRRRQTTHAAPPAPQNGP